LGIPLDEAFMAHNTLDGLQLELLLKPAKVIDASLVSKQG
jgi:hypothetical protein